MPVHSLLQVYIRGVLQGGVGVRRPVCLCGIAAGHHATAQPQVLLDATHMLSGLDHNSLLWADISWVKFVHDCVRAVFASAFALSSPGVNPVQPRRKTLIGVCAGE